MKIFNGILEWSIPYISFYLLLYLLNYIRYKIFVIIAAIIIFTMGILLLINEDFYEKYTALLGVKNNFSKYMNYHNSSNKAKPYNPGWNYIGVSILTLNYLLFCTPSRQNEIIFNSNFFCNLIAIISLLLNSIIGLYFYKKFKNSKQYIFSCVLMFIILFYEIYLL